LFMPIGMNNALTTQVWTAP